MSTDGLERWKSKIKTLAEAIRLIRPGKRIYLSDGSTVPLALIPGLVDPMAPLGDNEIVHLMTLGDAPYTAREWAGRFRHNALFIGHNTREAVTDGRADYTPAFLSEVPRLIRSGRLPIDVALISVTPPDADGFCSFGTHVTIAPAATEVAELIIAEVNPQMPRVNSPARIHMDAIDAIVCANHPLPELPARPQTEATLAIARIVAGLIPNGATIQVGIGAVPNAILSLLTKHKDLGIHSEMISDGVIDLARRGVITGKNKALNQGKIVSSFIMGSRECYEFVGNNPMIELHPVDYTNDPFVIAQHDNMIAINAGIEIDLTGQVCSDSIGDRFYSGIGGQVDFIRGAARSKGGKPIIIIQSTARGGSISRIVPRLSAGGGVVTTRGDVHWVVTEFGCVNLHGLTVRERAMALISIAHPKFRGWLMTEAKKAKFIYGDQLESALDAPAFPVAAELRARLACGTDVVVRPAKLTDETLLREMFYRLSEETVYRRFCGIIKYMPHKDLQRFCNVDGVRDMTLVATITRGVVDRAVGFASYNMNPKTGYAEVAVVVDDEYQRRGIGKLLMKKLTELAKARDIKGFTAYTIGYNSPVLGVFRYTGHTVEAHPEPHGCTIRIPFSEHTPHAPVPAIESVVASVP